MIGLVDVTRFVGAAHRPKIILDNVCLRVEPFEHVGILATSGSGKSTLARIIAGLETPDSGHVVSNGSLSWPIGFTSAMHPALSPADNVALVAKLRNLDAYELIAKVEDFSELGASFWEPMSDLSPGMRAQLGLALSLNVDFDVYLADDMNTVAQPDFRAKCDAALLDRGASAATIILSRHPRVIAQYCATPYVLAGAKLIACENAEQAQDILKISNTPEHSSHALI